MGKNKKKHGNKPAVKRVEQVLNDFSSLSEKYGSGGNKDAPGGQKPQDKATAASQVVTPPPVQAAASQNRRTGKGLLVPSDTWAHFSDPKEMSVEMIDNLSLRYNKYLNYDGEDKALVKLNFEGKKFDDWKFNSEEIQRVSSKLADSAEKISPLKPVIMRMTTDWRVAMGLGTSSVLENALSFHHVYGFPYIPGQSFKGAIRSFVINMYFGKESEALQDLLFCTLFGSDDKGVTGERAGELIFFDVYPCTPPKIEKDILNPHYTPYYRDGSHSKPPGDYYSPIPVEFLTVKATTYNFIVALPKDGDKEFSNEKWGSTTKRKLVTEWIEKALSIFGIGAKTAVGYGRFSKKS